MKGYLIDSPAGVFLLEKTGKVVEKALFSPNPRDTALSLSELKKGSLPGELSTFAGRLSGLNIETVTVDSDYLDSAARKLGIGSIVLDERDETIAKLRNRLPNILVRLRIVESKDHYDQLVRDVSMEIAKSAIASAGTKRDLYAIQTVRCIEDLDKTMNLLAGRIREWYGLHFPELDRLVDKHDTYIRLVQNLGTRDSFSVENLAKLGIPQERAVVMSEMSTKSAGAEMPGPDLEWLRDVSGSVLQLYKLRETAEKYTDKVMTEVAPNMTSILGAVLSAKLVSIAGGLTNLAKMPASTLQVLGAEKALFRTLKTGARPPKHGIIFQYGPIHQSPKWLRGKIARVVAGKLAIAARMDAFGGGNQGDRFKGAVDAKIKELKERYQEQPPRKKHGSFKGEGPPEVQRGILGRPSQRRPEAGHFERRTRDQRVRGAGRRR